MDAQEYLHRIQINHAEPPSLDFLARLQIHHLETVPFENLDVRAGEPILLEVPRLFRKIVAAGRGGFCYELNGLFGWLLRALGFSVTRLGAGVYSEDRGAFGPDHDHMTLLVHLDQDYLVDVGFGDSFRTPLPVPAGQVEDVSGRYRLAPTRDGSDRLELQFHETSGWAPQYRFGLAPQRLADFEAECMRTQTSPDSSFTRRLVCTRATPTGRLTLSPSSLTVTAGMDKHKVAITEPEAYFDLLEAHFGITLQPALQTALMEVVVQMRSAGAD